MGMAVGEPLITQIMDVYYSTETYFHAGVNNVFICYPYAEYYYFLYMTLFKITQEYLAGRIMAAQDAPPTVLRQIAKTPQPVAALCDSVFQ